MLMSSACSYKICPTRDARRFALCRGFVFIEALFGTELLSPQTVADKTERAVTGVTAGFARARWSAGNASRHGVCLFDRRVKHCIQSRSTSNCPAIETSGIFVFNLTDYGYDDLSRPDRHLSPKKTEGFRSWRRGEAADAIAFGISGCLANGMLSQALFSCLGVSGRLSPFLRPPLF